MNKKRCTPMQFFLPLSAAAVFGLAACGGGGHSHSHGADHDHSHADGKGHEEGGADHAHEEGEEGHDGVAGPNGGRVLHEFVPHAEFFITDDKKVRITFVDDDIQPIAAEEQAVSVIAGDRANPTQLSFAKNGEFLVSDGTLPEGDDYPVIVQIKATPDAEVVTEKFNLDLTDCPTCDYLEYACVCDHDHDH